MSYFCLLTMIVTLLSFPSLHAQTTEAEIESRLLHKPLFLQGQWSDSRLSFDEQGHLVGKSDPVPFTLAGIDVDSVKLLPGKLSIAGHRMGVVFKKDLPERVQVTNSGSRSNMPVKIEIKSPVSGDWNEALTGVFLPDLISLVRQMPSYWLPFGKEQLIQKVEKPSQTEEAEAEWGSKPSVESKRFPGAITMGSDTVRPEILKQTDVDFNDISRAMHFSGEAVLALVVNTAGRTEQIQILHPAGLGMDERAVASVSKWKFKPATRAGVPVAIELHVAISFQTK